VVDVRIVLFDLPKHCDLLIHAQVENAKGAVVSDVIFKHQLRAGALGSPTAAQPWLIEGTKCVITSSPPSVAGRR
jgi:hypothetical protein